MLSIKEKIKGTSFYYPLRRVKRKLQTSWNDIYCYFVSKFFNRFLLNSVVAKTRTKVQHNKPISIGFAVWNTAMWKYESLYRALEKNDNFVPYIIFHPNPGQTMEVRNKALEQLTIYFNHNHYRVYKDIQWNDIDLEYDDGIKEEIDILFLTQLPNSNLPIKSMTHFLLCYCMYGFATFCKKENQNRITDNILWKYFVESPALIEETKQVTFNKARNRVYTGSIFGDILSEKELTKKDPWKKTDDKVKRVIWAPHFSILEENYFHISNFLQMSELMLTIAEEYSEKIQFAFKPHPFLYTALCKEECWGKEKTDQYYSRWDSMNNTQLETGDYIDLFHTSDAIIHDCGSFIIEYLFENKPALYIDKVKTENGFSTMSKEGLKCYYHGTDENHIRHFLEDIVIEGHDEMKQKREYYYDTYLIPPNGRTAAENIVIELEKALGI